jgi:hypothetical protein
MRASPGVVTTVLAQLKGLSLIIEENGRYRYEPRSEDLRRIVDELSIVASERPMSVIKIIADPHSALRRFADAFRIRQD